MLRYLCSHAGKALPHSTLPFCSTLLALIRDPPALSHSQVNPRWREQEAGALPTSCGFWRNLEGVHAIGTVGSCHEDEMDAILAAGCKEAGGEGAGLRSLGAFFQGRKAWLRPQHEALRQSDTLWSVEWRIALKCSSTACVKVTSCPLLWEHGPKPRLEKLALWRTKEGKAVSCCL